VSLPLPTLDDRRWDELVEEGRALIPLYAPDWTDHNVSDPGITFTELFAWLAEMQGFQLDQIPVRHRLKFLSLVGIAPLPPQPARTVVQFCLADGSYPMELPATIECGQTDELAEHVRYRTLEALHVVAARLERITSVTLTGNRDLTGRWRRGESFAPFGDDPRPGAALVLELSAPVPPGVPVTIYVSPAEEASARAERARIEDAVALREARCRTPESLVDCEQADDPAPCGEQPLLLEHHSARTVWELRVGPGRWRRLDPAAGEVADHTRALTLSGTVEIVVPESAAGSEPFRLRCRLARGAYDEAPLLLDLAINGVEAVQALPAADVWPIAPGATVLGVPEPGRDVHLRLELDEDDRIRLLDVTDASAPAGLLLAYVEPSPTEPGSLTVEARFLGRSDGSPEQTVELADPPVESGSVRVWTLGEPDSSTAARRWQLRPDLDASGPAYAHAVLDAARGTIVFGDAERGLVPLKDSAIVVAYDATRAEAGNVRARAINVISSSAHNRALLPDDARAALEVTNPVPGTDGTAAETLEGAEGRAAMLVEERTRAVTSADYEALARATPGVRLARVAARPNTHPGFPCVEAVGVVTVIVLPYLPADRPQPSLGLLRAVSAHLAGHRLVGTRVEVTGPTYSLVSVRARIGARRLVDRAELVRRVGETLDRFFHPLLGGPDGTGWPFGRDVVRSEVLQVVDGVAGVEHVLDLELVAPGGVSCGTLCIGPLGLVDSGPHEIEVLAE
jgi:Baseplate J-like protein